MSQDISENKHTPSLSWQISRERERKGRENKAVVRTGARKGPLRITNGVILRAFLPPPPDADINMEKSAFGVLLILEFTSVLWAAAERCFKNTALALRSCVNMKVTYSSPDLQTLSSGTKSPMTANTILCFLLMHTFAHMFTLPFFFFFGFCTFLFVQLSTIRQPPFCSRAPASFPFIWLYISWGALYLSRHLLPSGAQAISPLFL